jgi:hydrogenase/urease accessory protein HupE
MGAVRITRAHGNKSAVILLSVLILFCVAPSALAHRLRPAIVTISFEQADKLEVEISLNMEAVLAGISPTHEDTDNSPNAPEYDQLREMQPNALAERIRAFQENYLAGINIAFDGRPATLYLVSAQVPDIGDTTLQRLSTLNLRGAVPDGANAFTWTYAKEFGASAVRVGPTRENIIRTTFLNAGVTSEAFPLDDSLVAKTTPEVAIEYLILGFEHIVPKGLDHILFVLGIFFLSLHWKPLLYQVTAFTIAHSITLGLSLYGLVSLPPSIVEPLIALSICYVALENVLTADLKPWRVYVVFAFGLLHGLGFAGVLIELGLPRNEFLTALITFNVGVELGQLTVITAAFAIVGYWFREKPWYRRRIVIPVSLLIAATGAYWTIERIIA